MLLSQPASSAECLCTWLCSVLPLFWALSVVRSPGGGVVFKMQPPTSDLVFLNTNTGHTGGRPCCNRMCVRRCCVRGKQGGRYNVM